jgi:sRNA-binding carbon storage regulator CsrA
MLVLTRKSSESVVVGSPGPPEDVVLTASEVLRNAAQRRLARKCDNNWKTR